MIVDLTEAEMATKVKTDEDFIALKRFGYSLAQLMERYPEGCPDDLIAKAILVPEGRVEVIYQRAVRKLRKIMGVSL